MTKYPEIKTPTDSKLDCYSDRLPQSTKHPSQHAANNIKRGLL